MSVFVNLHQCGLVLGSSVSHCLYCHVQLSHHSVSLFVSASTCQVNVCFPSSVMLLHLSPGLTSVSLHEQCCLLVLSCVSLVFRSLSLLLTLHRLGLHVFSHVLPFFLKILMSTFYTCSLKVTNTSLIRALTVDVLK